MLIRELMAEKDFLEIITVSPEATLKDTAGILRQHNIGALIVLDEGRNLQGIISERDLVRAVWEFGGDLVHQPVSEWMTRTVITCSPHDCVLSTLSVMAENCIRHIPVMDDGEILAMISIREFDHACKRLEIQAHTDELTGLANRRSFLGVLESEYNRFQRYDTPFSVAMLDIDHFKQINDQYGHEAGDRVLRTLADLMVRELRPNDVVGRIGGEEFAVLFPHTELMEAKVACDRLLNAIRAEDLLGDGGAIRFTVSFGLADIHQSGGFSEAILKRADDLLYQAKAKGRDRIVAEVSVGHQSRGDREKLSA